MSNLPGYERAQREWEDKEAEQPPAGLWDCADATPEEDHDWKLIAGDSSVGEGDYMECRQCGKTREATEQEVADSYNDCDLQDWNEK